MPRSERRKAPTPVEQRSEPGQRTTGRSGDFARRLIAWHRRHGRHDLPWQTDRDPYRVWLSEIMLQQTQVATVLPYYARFLQRFADIGALAAATGDDVMSAWAGLGYYARARNLHACARRVVQDHAGRFPASAEALAQLPGIGPSTAAAIAAFCFGERGAILDGNVKRVLARHWAIDGFPGRADVARALWERARHELPPARSIAAYTQAIMDLGATVCTRSKPDCGRCPVRASCQAHRDGREAQLPARRPARARPVQTVHVLVALRGGSVLLQRRAPQGIWGGLMCLPQFDTPAALKRAARALHGGATRLEALPPRRHELTHLSLALEPHRLVLGEANLAGASPKAHAQDAADMNWFTLQAAARAGMPVPHRRLLDEAGDAVVASGRRRR